MVHLQDIVLFCIWSIHYHTSVILQSLAFNIQDWRNCRKTKSGKMVLITAYWSAFSCASAVQLAPFWSEWFSWKRSLKCSSKISVVKVKMEQIINITLCFKLDKTTAETYEMSKQVYCEETLSRSRTFEWFKCLWDGRESVEDDPHTGWPRLWWTHSSWISSF